MELKPDRYGMYESYGRSKLAMVLFTTELNYIYADKGVYAASVHPGECMHAQLPSACTLIL
jgi:NAD(P)-dependent dehydrogenase (short-subunit alcohol dehydrogenase family)